MKPLSAAMDHAITTGIAEHLGTVHALQRRDLISDFKPIPGHLARYVLTLTPLGTRWRAWLKSLR